jgi:hypothetical protein
MPVNYGGGSSSPSQSQSRTGGGGFDVQAIIDRYMNQANDWETTIGEWRANRGGGGGGGAFSSFGGGGGEGPFGGAFSGLFNRGGDGGNAGPPDGWTPFGDRGPMPRYQGGPWRDYQMQIVDWWRGGGNPAPPPPRPIPPPPGNTPLPGIPPPTRPNPPVRPAIGAEGGGIGGVGREAAVPRPGEPWDAYLKRLGGF